MCSKRGRHLQQAPGLGEAPTLDDYIQEIWDIVTHTYAIINWTD